jgi:hypothetical protein
LNAHESDQWSKNGKDDATIINRLPLYNLPLHKIKPVTFLKGKFHFDVGGRRRAGLKKGEKRYFGVRLIPDSNTEEIRGHSMKDLCTISPI